MTMRILKTLMAVAVLTGGISLLGPARADAAPMCGPANLASIVNNACARFKPTWKDLLYSAFLPAYGVSKATFYTACKGIANSGYLVDAVARGCCVTHDACYDRGGTSECKVGCDSTFYWCTHSALRIALAGPVVADAIFAAATSGGTFTFNYTNDHSCGW